MSLYTPNPNDAVFELPLGLHTVERRYTPQANGDDSTYKQDVAYFRGRKGRWIAVRRATAAEFDNMEATFSLDGALIQPPAAWVRVTRHPTLGFRVVLVWRGALVGVPVDEQGYLSLESDDAVDFILRSMTSQGCANWDEVKTYFTKLQRAKDIHNARNSMVYGSGKVH